jgi:hypothetical protein
LINGAAENLVGNSGILVIWAFVVSKYFSKRSLDKALICELIFFYLSSSNLFRNCILKGCYTFFCYIVEVFIKILPPFYTELYFVGYNSALDFEFLKDGSFLWLFVPPFFFKGRVDQFFYEPIIDWLLIFPFVLL